MVEFGNVERRCISMSELLVVASKVRAYLKEKDAKMSGDLPEAINKKVMEVLDDAVMRAKGNKRTTVKPQDA
jgi:histone H3/H4